MPLTLLSDVFSFGSFKIQLENTDLNEMSPMALYNGVHFILTTNIVLTFLGQEHFFLLQNN